MSFRIFEVVLKQTDKWIRHGSKRLRNSEMSAMYLSEFNILLAPCSCNKMELPCRVGSLFLGTRIWTYIIKLFRSLLVEETLSDKIYI
jgi:hypothetical protein